MHSLHIKSFGGIWLLVKKKEAEVNEWISRGVDIQSFFHPFKEVFGREKIWHPNASTESVQELFVIPPELGVPSSDAHFTSSGRLRRTLENWGLQSSTLVFSI